MATNRIETKGQRGNFFAIDKNQWSGVCELGMNAALLYLILARGSDKQNVHSNWSANALERYTRVARRRAKAAKETLLTSDYVKVLRGGKYPKYELPRSPNFQEKQDEIWLPNELVTGADGEVTAIERVRQTGDVMRLRLLVDLYHRQNLVDDCGVARDCVYESYKRKRIAESGIYTIWGFKGHVMNCSPQNEAVAPHHVDDSEYFLERFNTLRDLGLVQVTPYLCESNRPDAEIIHPLVSVFDGDDLSCALNDVLFKLLPDQYHEELWNHGFVVPVPRHIGEVAVVGIAQTRFRPKTSLTAAGKAHHLDLTSKYVALYDEIAV
jgi:hypothetical protein